MPRHRLSGWRAYEVGAGYRLFMAGTAFPVRYRLVSLLTTGSTINSLDRVNIAVGRAGHGGIPGLGRGPLRGDLLGFSGRAGAASDFGVGP